MSKQETYYEWQSTGEPAPVNRRVYEAAKLPFAYLAQFLWWASSPWRRALPLALAGATVLTGFLSLAGDRAFSWIEFGSVAVIATALLGAAIVVLYVLRAVFE